VIAAVPPCPSGKVALERETAAFDGRRLGLRAYLCPRRGFWHLSSKPKLRPRVPTLSARNANGCGRCERAGPEPPQDHGARDQRGAAAAGSRPVGRHEREGAEVSAARLTSVVRVEDYDPLRDKSYRHTALGADVVAWLSWLELGGAAERTLDQYERDLAVLCNLYPSKGLADLTDLELGAAVRRFPPASRRVRKAAFDSFYRWAIRTRRIDRNPMELLPAVKRRPQRYIDVFSEAELDDLLALPLVDSVLMLILADAGLRRGEACALQVRRLKVDT
jgi:hypothetical protein